MGDRCYRAWVGPWVAAQAGNPVEGAVSVSPNQGSVTVLGLIDLQNREEPRDGGKVCSPCIRSAFDGKTSHWGGTAGELGEA